MVVGSFAFILFHAHNTTMVQAGLVEVGTYQGRKSVRKAYRKAGSAGYFNSKGTKIASKVSLGSKKRTVKRKVKRKKRK